MKIFSRATLCYSAMSLVLAGPAYCEPSVKLPFDLQAAEVRPVDGIRIDQFPLRQIVPEGLLRNSALKLEPALAEINQALPPRGDRPAEAGAKIESIYTGSGRSAATSGPFNWQQASCRGKTARPQVAHAIKVALRKGWLGKRNLDLGGGPFMLHTRAMKRRGVRNEVLDTFNCPLEHNRLVLANALKKPFDSATITNVLTAIENPEDRLALLITAGRLVKEGGKIIVSIAKPAFNQMKAWPKQEKHMDGVVTTAGTFYGNIGRAGFEQVLGQVFYHVQVLSYQRSRGWIAVASGLRPFSRQILEAAFLREFRQFEPNGRMTGHLLGVAGLGLKNI